MRVIGLLLAAGLGERLAAGVPKALLPIGGRSMLEHAYAGLTADPRVDTVVVTAPAAEAADLADALAGRAVVVAGGRTRQESVRLALAVLESVAEDPGQTPADVVLVHDAARPFVPADMVARVIDAVLGGADAAVPALAVSDTIKRVGPTGAVVATLDRAELRAVQTPQGFRPASLASAHQYAARAGLQDVTDDAALIERHGGRVVVVEGSHDAFKITRPWDLRLAELLVKERQR